MGSYRIKLADGDTRESAESVVDKYVGDEEQYLESIWNNEYGLVSDEDRERLKKIILERIAIEGGKWNGKIYGGLYKYLHIYIKDKKRKKRYLQDYLDNGFLWGDYKTKLVAEIEKQRKKDEIPVIDIDDEEIPF
ncbi:hypothetical protein [Helicobacter sp. UBA3407]|uniref:hypothetical protein n=1 Tax=Helicobacter sp. UBA3407 TaxID=1946588 RepID=UPI0026351221|nr:hypothetical protein [Helicobacter sp. UBA3407]